LLSLSRFPVLRTSDPVQLYEAVSAHFPGVHSFIAKRTSNAPWHAAINHTALGDAGVTFARSSGLRLTDPPRDLVCVFVPLGTPFHVEHGATSRDFLPHRPGIVPGGEITMRFVDGNRFALFQCSEVSVIAALQEVESRLELMELQDGFFGSGMLPLDPFQKQLKATVRALDGAPEAIISTDRFKAAHQELLTLQLAQCLAGDHVASRKGPIGRHYLSRAIDYLRAHYTEDVRLSKLAAEAGCSLRTLQLAFRQELDATPNRYLNRLRLDAAQKRLRSADVGDTVTSIALECGFSHMGEFASSYRQAFGERPSETLAHALGAALR
jgi:AraC-like DNA-binding protein